MANLDFTSVFAQLNFHDPDFIYFFNKQMNEQVAYDKMEQARAEMQERYNNRTAREFSILSINRDSRQFYNLDALYNGDLDQVVEHINQLPVSQRIQYIDPRLAEPMEEEDDGAAYGFEDAELDDATNARFVFSDDEEFEDEDDDEVWVQPIVQPQPVSLNFIQRRSLGNDV
jgi:hypothetical protein